MLLVLEALVVILTPSKEDCMSSKLSGSGLDA